jgi:AAA family ATPase
MRPGRLDRLLYVGPPDARGREEILAIRLAKMSVEPGLDLQHLASLVGLYLLPHVSVCSLNAD